MVDTVLSAGLCMPVANPERPDTRSVASGGILKASDFLTARADEGEALDAHLDMTAGRLLAVTLGVD